ncbi:MAG: repair protein SbcD/Mre11, partial [Acidimicrobiaceae bacterium]
DAVLVVGDLFDTAAPTPEAERIVYRALLDLADTGATVIVLAGNHDSERRLQAIEPVLERGLVITRPVFAKPDEGGVVEVVSRDGSERAKVACLPFLSQRYVVKAADLMEQAASDSTQQYAQRMRLLLAALAEGFRDDTVNVIAAHCMVDGATVAGSERTAHTIFEYAVPSVAFPSSAHYVALGHLHRQQAVAGPGQIRYCGSPLQLDFGEVADAKGVLIIDAKLGAPADVRPVLLQTGRRLVALEGTLDELRAHAGTTGDAYLKIKVREKSRVGLADEVRELFPDAVDVVVERPEPEGGHRATVSRAGLSPRDLFGAYLTQQGVDDPRLVTLFDELLDEAATG